MSSGYRGTFVISWQQTALDGDRHATPDMIRTGLSWVWRGKAVRVDGPAGVLQLAHGQSEGLLEDEMRARAAQSVRKLLKAVQVNSTRLDLIEVEAPANEQSFSVTNGREIWPVTVIEGATPRVRLCMFVDAIPPEGQALWIVDHAIWPKKDRQPGHVGEGAGLMCFTPGTTILTQSGKLPVEAIRPGTKIQTKDNGLQEVLWVGRRYMSGARFLAMPHLRPIRIHAGALDRDVPDAKLLVSPDHRMVVKGARARALFNTNEVLVTARDLVNGRTIYVDQHVRAVEYIHLLLPQHEVMFANGLESESFHPDGAGLDHLGVEAREQVNAVCPGIVQNPKSYGAHARRLISAPEAAILYYDAA